MGSDRSSSVRPLLFLLGAVVLWGTSYAVTKTAYTSIPPMYVVWGRMIIAFLVFLPMLGRVKRPAYQQGDWKLLGLAGLCIPCLYFLLEGYAISFTTSGQAGVISAVMPLIVAVAAWIVLRETPSWRTMTAVGLSMLGVAVLSLMGSDQASAPNPVLGNLLELGAMMAAAGSTLTVKRLSERYSPLLLTGFQMAVGCVFFAPVALLSGPIDLPSVPLSAWMSVGYLGIGCGLAAFGLYNSALRLMPVSRAALAINAIPVVALVCGWALMGETMSWFQIGACALILGSVVFAQFRVREPVSTSDTDPVL